MEVVWSREGRAPVSVREVHETLAADRAIAYTTVMTVLDRLAGKGLLTREREGRAFLYQARASRAELTAELMRDALDDFTSEDRDQALVAFVGDASADDVEALRRALADLENP